MTSKISSRRSWLIYTSGLNRLKWFSILYGILLFLGVPLVLWMDLARQTLYQGPQMLEGIYPGSISNLLFNPAISLMNISVPIIFGLIIFHYLQNERESTFFHSLPLKRTSLYLQNLMAGLTLIWIPILINSIIVYGVFLKFGVVNVEWQQFTTGEVLKELIPLWQVVGYWLLVTGLMTGLFFIFTSFVGLFTGNTLLQGALTLIGLLLPLGLYVLIRFNLSKILYGYPEGLGGKMREEWLSPIVSYLSLQNQYFIGSWIGYLIYGLIAIMLVVGGIYLYRLRQVEAAGETLAAEWIRWVFKYGVAICTAMAGGAYFNSIFRDSVDALYLGYFIGAALGYIIADVIAHKSFQFYKRWKQILTFGLVFTLLVFAVKVDIFGYQTYVPEAEEIKQVSLGNYFFDEHLGRGLSEKENIEKVRELHQEIIRNRDRNMDLTEDKLRMNLRIEFSYLLKDGDSVKRVYTISVDKYKNLLGPILGSKEGRKLVYAKLLEIEPEDLEQISINNHRQGKNLQIHRKEEIEKVLKALKEDVMNTSYQVILDRIYFGGPQIEFNVKNNENHIKTHYYLPLHPEFKEVESFLLEYNYLEKVFVDPEEIREVIIGQTGNEKEVTVTDKEEIRVLLNIGYKEDANGHAWRIEQGAKEKLYYAKVIQENGETMYLGFDYNPYTQDKLGVYFDQ